jgi:hypothetical protein
VSSGQRPLAAARSNRYKPDMRRATRLGLAVLIPLLVLLGAYTAYWLTVAGRIKDGFAAWAQTERGEKIDVTWQNIGVTGFPFGWRVALGSAVLRDGRVTPPPELRIPALLASARPWDFGTWRLAAPEGLSAALAGAGERPALKLSAQTAAGVLTAGKETGTTVWLSLQDISAQAGEAVPISSGNAWVILPAKPPRTHTDPNLGVALDLRQMRLSEANPVLGETIDELAFGVTVKGAFPSGPLAHAVSVWRDDGGTIELDNLRLEWGGLDATATGTIALDRELQPTGGFSGAIEGYDQILTALVQSGRMRATDAGLARLALAMLAKAGPDGKPAIATAFTIQNGQMFLGPARLGKAPRLVWE